MSTFTHKDAGLLRHPDTVNLQYVGKTISERFRLVRTGTDGWHFAIAVAGDPGGLKHTRDLAGVEDPDAPRGRAMRFVLADEGPCRSVTTGPKASFVLERGQWEWICPLPMIFIVEDEQLRLGTVTALQIYPAGKIPGTIGSCLVGVAIFGQTVLATISWRGVRTGMLDATCAIFWTRDDEKGERLRSGRIEAVQLETVAAACCPRARILESWVEATR